MKKYIIILIASLMATTIHAQTLTSQDKREFYQKAYDIIVEYGQLAAMGKEQDKIDLQKYRQLQFSRLFVNQNIMICNDLMVLNDKKTLPVWKYVQDLRQAEEVEVRIMNLQKGEITDGDSVWHVEVMFDKSITIVNSCFSLFDSDEIFGNPFHLKATLAIDKVTGQCLICALEPNGTWNEFPKNYRILQMNESDQRDKKLYINNRRVVFNKYGQVFLHGNSWDSSKDKITYNRGKVEETDLGEECGAKIEVNYQDKFWRIRPNFGLSLSGFNKIGNNGSLSLSDDSEMSYGVDFGYVFKTYSNFKTGFFAGFGFSKNKYSLEWKGSEDCFETDEDEDGDTYIRHYKIWGDKGGIQKYEGNDLTIPIYADLEYEVNYLLSVYTNFGVKLHMPSGKWSAEIDKYETWGVYEKYNNLTIRNCNEDGTLVKNPVTLNDFGIHNDTEVSSIGVDESIYSPKTSLDFLFGAGIRLNLSKSFAFDAGIQYQIGGKNWKSEGKNIFSYTLATGDRVDLLSKAGDIKRGAMRVTASLIYKF